MKRLLGIVIAFVLAALAQRSLSEGGIPSDAAILYALAAIAFVAVAEKPAPWPEPAERRDWPAWSLLATGLATLLGVAAFVLFWIRRGSPLQFSGLPLWLWLVSVVLFLVAVIFGERRRGESPQAPDSVFEPWLSRARGYWREHRWQIILLVLILVAAFALRVWHLNSIPNGCQSDECNNGLDALDWLAGAPYQPYAETNEGQATLFTYLLAGSIGVLDRSVWAMRIVSALVGSLTVLVFYFLARDLFDWKVALAATALLAASRWHLTFSRIVYELIMVPLFEILLVLFLLRALRRGRRRDWASAGVALSVGLNTYTGFRVIPFLVLVFLVYWAVYSLLTRRWRSQQTGVETETPLEPEGLRAQPSRWRSWRRDRLLQDLEGVGSFGLGSVLTILPLGVYVLQHWSVFISRTQHISVFRDVERVGSYAPLWENLRKTLYMFNWQGDTAALNNLPGAPLLSLVVGMLFVLGLAYVLRYVYRPVPFLFVAWFLSVASLAVLSVAHEAPTARRPIGLVPLIYLLVAQVIHQAWQAVRHAGWRGRRAEQAFAGVLGLVVVVVGVTSTRTYFLEQAQDPRVLFAYSPNESAVGRYLAELQGDPLVLMTPQYSHHSAVAFIGQRSTTPLNLATQVPLREDIDRDLLYVLEPVDERLGPLFQQVYPGGAWEVHRDELGRALFISFRVPQETLEAARGLSGRYFEGSEPTGTPALAQREKTLSFDWAEQSIMEHPFAASWRGALLVPRYGQYQMALRAEGGLGRVYLDGKLLVEAENGLSEEMVTLAGGFYGFEADFVSGPDPHSFTLGWAGPDFALQTIGEGALYSLPGAANGLVGYYYSNANWNGTPALIQRDLFILPNNPLREPYGIMWKGKLAAPRAGTYRIGTRSDDGSFVSIDGQLVVDNGGEHGSEYREGMIELEQGFHDIEVRYFQVGGSREMQLWWSPAGGRQEIIPSQYLFPLEEVPEGLELPALVVEPEPTRPIDQIPVEDTIPTGPGETVAPLSQPGEVADLPRLSPEVVWRVGDCGSGSSQFQAPRGVAMDDAGNVYVADAGNHRVVKLSPDGEAILAWGTEGEGSGQFIEPFDLVVNSDGEVLVLDSVAHQVQRFSPEGEFLAVFGKDMAFYRPRGLGSDAEGNVYVADTGGVRLLKLSPTGAWLMQVGGPEEAIGPGQPTDVAVATDGQAYAVEAMSGSLWQLRPDGTVESRWAVAQANTLESPHVAIDEAGRVYVTDPEGGRVQVFTAEGRPVGQFGADSGEAGPLHKPVGIDLGRDGQVVVSSSQSCRITLFAPIP